VRRGGAAELQRAGDAPKLCGHRHYPYRALTVRRAELARAGGAREARGMPAAPQHSQLLSRRDEQAAAAARRALERQEVLGAVRPPLELREGGQEVVQECAAV
jgi:hypothetical protein